MNLENPNDVSLIIDILNDLATAKEDGESLKDVVMCASLDHGFDPDVFKIHTDVEGDGFESHWTELVDDNNWF